MLHDRSPFFIGVGYRLNFKYDIVWYIINHSAKTVSEIFYRKPEKFFEKLQLNSKSQRQENMHNKFVERKCKSIINQPIIN